MHLVRGQQLAEGFNCAIHSLSVNKANPDKIWTTIWIFWLSTAHIKAYFPTIRPQNNKKDSKIDPSLRLTKTTTRGISAFNFRRFRQPIRSCGIILKANQRFGQNQAVTSINVNEFVSGPISEEAVRENVWEPLKLGLISGYEPLETRA